MTEVASQGPDRKLITQLVPDSAGLYALVQEGLRRVEARPDDTFAVLSTFVLLDSLRSWRQHEQRRPFEDAPYAETVREIANGTKHLRLRPSAHPELHVSGIEPEGDWDSLDWEDLGFPGAMISLYARPASGEAPHWKSARGVLREAVEAWGHFLEVESRSAARGAGRSS